MCKTSQKAWEGVGWFWKHVFVCAWGKLMPAFAKPFYAFGPVCLSLQCGDNG